MHKFDYLVPHFVTHVLGMRIIVTSKVEFANYPSCEHLRTVSKDELSSRFHETPSS